MRVSREQLASHRDSILTAAGRLFRARGIEGVSVADVMQAAGLTHGGFYRHYRSKAELAAASCRGVLAQSAARWHERAQDARASGDDPVDVIVSGYLSSAMIAEPERGCIIPSLGAEIGRAGGEPAAALSDGIDQLLTVLAGLSERAESERPAAAMAAFSAMVGAVVLARACANPERATAILAAARVAACAALKSAD